MYVHMFVNKFVDTNARNESIIYHTNKETRTIKYFLNNWFALQIISFLAFERS